MDVFYFYIIFSAQLNRYYVGQTDNLKRRITDHTNSRSTYTKKSQRLDFSL